MDARIRPAMTVKGLKPSDVTMKLSFKNGVVSAPLCESSHGTWHSLPSPNRMQLPDSI